MLENFEEFRCPYCNAEVSIMIDLTNFILTFKAPLPGQGLVIVLRYNALILHPAGVLGEMWDSGLNRGRTDSS